MTKDEALKLALEGLEKWGWGDDPRGAKKYIADMEKALAQPEQTNTRPYYTIDELNAWADEKEKQAWRNAAIRIGEELSSVGPDGYYDMNAWQWLDWAMENVKKARPEQEPVAVKHMMEWVDYLKRKSDYGRHMKIPSEMSAGACWELAIELEQFINTTQPQRKPLTDEEITDAVRESGLDWHYAWTLSDDESSRLTKFARAIEAAHGIKGEA